MKAYKISGEDAVRLAERDGLTVYCHANPVDDGGVVTSETARQIMREDASLVYVVVVEHRGWTPGQTPCVNISDYFRGQRYLGPDEDGLEPTFADAPATELVPKAA